MQQKLTGSWPWDFWGRNFHVFCPCVRLFCGSVPSGFGSPEATQIADPANGRCVCFWSPGAADSHFTRKRNGLSPQKKASCDFGLPLLTRDTSHGHRSSRCEPSGSIHNVSMAILYGLAPRVTWNITWNKENGIPRMVRTQNKRNDSLCIFARNIS